MTMPIRRFPIVPMLLALPALAVLAACEFIDESSTPTPGCSPAFHTDLQFWDPLALDPRPPGMPPGHAAEFFLRIEMWDMRNGGLEVFVDADFSTDQGHAPGFDSAVAHCVLECPMDPEAFECSIDDADGEPQALHARLVGNRLVGTLEVEGYPTSFDVGRR
jgi:hypothetical protein